MQSLYSGFNYTGGRGKASPFEVCTSCPEDVFDNASPDLRVPQLPWRLQEDWGCERTPTSAYVIVAENEFLRAAITPQWGGKVWSLYHKKDQRQLFFNNPAHQPANIGYRKAWSSGGAEWNWGPGKIGHSVFTESPVWTAVLPTEMGPIVRVWEYDRLNSTVWQVGHVTHVTNVTQVACATQVSHVTYATRAARNRCQHASQAHTLHTLRKLYAGEHAAGRRRALFAGMPLRAVTCRYRWTCCWSTTRSSLTLRSPTRPPPRCPATVGAAAAEPVTSGRMFGDQLIVCLRPAVDRVDVRCDGH